MTELHSNGEYPTVEPDVRLHGEDLREELRLDSTARPPRPAGLIVEQLRHGHPRHPASIAAVLTRQGSGYRGGLVAKVLAVATAPGGHHAAHVIYPSTSCSRTSCGLAGPSGPPPSGCRPSPQPSTPPTL